jgi:hypothetical protein
MGVRPDGHTWICGTHWPHDAYLEDHGDAPAWEILLQPDEADQAAEILHWAHASAGTDPLPIVSSRWNDGSTN